jgi:hypothetical protein
MEIESAADRLIFFEPKEFADTCDLIDHLGARVTIAVIFDKVTDPVTLYETNIEAPNPSFTCRVEDLAFVIEKEIKTYRAELRGVSYKLEKIEDTQDGFISRVFLKK